MKTSFLRPHKPRWWPENEPWPPRRGGAFGGRRRHRLFELLVVVAGLLIATSVVGPVALAWLGATTGGPAATTPGPWPRLFTMAGIAGASVFAVALVSAMFPLVTSIDRVMEAADRVAAGNYAVRVPEEGPAQMRALVRAFNTMAGRLQNDDRLRRDLMADIAHELRTPLTVMQGKLEGLLDGVYPRDTAHLRQLLDETHVLVRLVEDLRTVAMSDSGTLKLEKETVDIAALARDVAGAFAGDAGARQLTLAVEAPGAAPIAIDPVRIREVMSNLLSNALRHTPPGGSVFVRVAAADAGGVSVEVRDTGAGMTPEEIARAFDRFYKGGTSRGSGLGLTIARGLVAAHGGEMQASSAPGRGTTIAFTLPAPS